MPPFTARAARFAGGFTVASGADAAFPLFSPIGEKAWVPGWDPRLVHPPGVEWAEGLIFTTHEELGEAVWVVTRLDRAARHVEYHRVEPGRYVAHVVVDCTPVSALSTDVRVVYEFIGLSERGNADIAAMAADAYAEKMTRWSRMIGATIQPRP